ncbi:hypothetical protein [Winogradskyella sp. UBA3174]|uniref:hypothetical protein n=1 Tax=Winogradskyella sp. UBA3174 TaxID=1947785 RepID=UPI0025FE92DC|nr:hypothetical protein [Winogradskyella sp. UBA3174]|tara:strand:+ start:8612 stop:10027 length:1416 start_codon:yes stop_codon:yes gene_type:complete
MKTRITILLIALFVSFNLAFAQEEKEEECRNNLSIFDSYANSKKYDDAYEPWMKVRKECPKLSRAIYLSNKGKGGRAIIDHKIENSAGAEKLAFIKDLLKLNEEYHANFTSKYSEGELMMENANLKYKYKTELGLSTEELYKTFDSVFLNHKSDFDSAIGLYAYFSLGVDIYDAGVKTPPDAQKLFDKYDDVNEIIEDIIETYTKKLNIYVAKEAGGETLSKREQSYKGSYESNIEVYESKILSSMDKKLGDRANCEVLVPLYQKDFEEYKNDAVWLQRAMNKMGEKECTDDPLFEKLVVQKNTVEPDAKTAFYLGFLKEKQGKMAEADRYYDQSFELESDPLKKWKLVMRVAEKNYKRGSYGKARQQYIEALNLNPSKGLPHLRMAAMYQKSANNCGDSNFNKRAVLWLAANEAEKAGRVDGRLKSTASKTAESYRAGAPSTADIFNEGNAGQTIKIGCWIRRSVTVPQI